MSTALASQILNADEAPPKPADPLGRYVSWVKVTMGPSFVYDGVTHIVTPEWIDDRVREWTTMTAGGYLVPLLQGHDPNASEQLRRGDVLDLRRWVVDGQPALIAAVGWAIPGAEAKIKAGEIRYLSPRFSSLTDDRGISYRLALVELSIVASSHQKRMGQTHILAGETIMPTDLPIAAPDASTPPEASSAPTADERLAACEARIAELGNGLAALTARLDASEATESIEDAAEVEAPPLDLGPAPSPADVAMGEELRQVKAALVAEKRHRMQAEFNAAYPTGANLVMGEDLRADLFALREANPAIFDRVLAHRTLPAAGTPAAPAPPLRSQMPWGISMGEAPSAPASVDTTPETDEQLLVRLRHENGNNATKAIAAFKALKGM